MEVLSNQNQPHQLSKQLATSPPIRAWKANQASGSSKINKTFFKIKTRDPLEDLIFFTTKAKAL